jgi:hypothetical protein
MRGLAAPCPVTSGAAGIDAGEPSNASLGNFNSPLTLEELGIAKIEGWILGVM